MESHKATKPQEIDPARLEEVARTVVDCGYHLHRDIGPGLLESVYEILLCAELEARGMSFRCQLSVPIEHRGVHNEMLSDRHLVEDCMLIE